MEPFDAQNAESDPEKVRAFNEDTFNDRLGYPTHTSLHEYLVNGIPIGTAFVNHHPRGKVLTSIHIDDTKRNQGHGSRFLEHLSTQFDTKLYPSGHYVSQKSLDWHNKNHFNFADDPEYSGNRIVEDEEGW